MKSYLSSPWSNAVLLVEMMFGSQQLATGTCFLWRHNDRLHLVTNWHNLAGRNHLTCDLLSPLGALPNCIRVHFWKAMSPPDEEGIYAGAVVPVVLPLVDPATKLPVWREHLGWGRAVDVAAMDITDVVANFEVAAVNELEDDALLEPHVSQDVFVVGYPFGSIAGAPVPIWKRGTLALEPTYDIDGLPKMFLDTATRPGMSGSVVLARHTIVNRRFDRKNGGSSFGRVPHAELDIVIGVYSGRHYPDHEKAQLGIVWKRTCIEQIVATGRVPDLG